MAKPAERPKERANPSIPETAFPDLIGHVCKIVIPGEPAENIPPSSFPRRREPRGFSRSGASHALDPRMRGDDEQMRFALFCGWTPVFAARNRGGRTGANPAPISIKMSSRPERVSVPSRELADGAADDRPSRVPGYLLRKFRDDRDWCFVTPCCLPGRPEGGPGSIHRSFPLPGRLRFAGMTGWALSNRAASENQAIHERANLFIKSLKLLFKEAGERYLRRFACLLRCASPRLRAPASCNTDQTGIKSNPDSRFGWMKNGGHVTPNVLGAPESRS